MSITVKDGSGADVVLDPPTSAKQDTQITAEQAIQSGIGATSDAAVTTNTTGSLSGKLRGLVAILADVWDSTNHRVKVDGSGVTQPVSSTTLATAAKQPALGTAGTPSADVLTVQGISGGTALPTLEQSRAAASTNVHAPASNTAAIVTYTAAGSGVSNVIGGIAWSYNATPTSGNLKIEDGSGTTVFSIDITVSGPGFIPFARPLKGTANTALIVTLAAGGSGVTGKVSVLSKWTE